jgi:hypothetical protein
MKHFLFYTVSWFILSNAIFTGNLFGQQLSSGSSRKESVNDNSNIGQMDYHENQPVNLFKPEIIIPDSLLNELLPVKVWVKIAVDSLGIPRSYQIMTSTNTRFNDLATSYALQYRFKADTTMIYNKYWYIAIPIIFKSRK